LWSASLAPLMATEAHCIVFGNSYLSSYDFLYVKIHRRQSMEEHALVQPNAEVLADSLRKSVVSVRLYNGQ